MNYVYIGLFILTIFFVIYALYLKYRRRRYTRERYAFAALSSTLLLSTLIVTTIFGTTPWNKILEFVFYLLDKEYQSTSSSWSEKLLAVIFVGYVIYVINRNFSSWSGLKSTRQYENEILFKNNTLLSEGIYELTRCIKREKIEVFDEKKSKQRTQKIETPIYNQPWRDEVKELIELKWASYKFNDEDWHELNNCWIGINNKTRLKVCVQCCTEEPTERQIEELISYSKSVVSQELLGEIIIVYKNGEDIKDLTINDRKIALYSHTYLLDNLVDFEDYFYDIKRRVLYEGLADSDIKLFDSYIQSTIINPNNNKPEFLEDYLGKWLKEKSYKQLSVLGEYGQGKSTGMLAFTYNLMSNDRISSYIPILIELRGKSPSTLQPIELFGAWASSYRVDPKSLFKLLQHGRLLLIFEGFDEMSQVGDSESRINHFRSIWKFCYKNSKMIITGRPNFFLDDDELKMALGIEESVASGPYCEAIHLQAFSYEQIKNSLRWLDVDSRTQIIKLAKADSNFYDVVSRPSLLFIVAILWKEKSEEFTSKNINSATVISLFINHSLRRQVEKQADGRKFMVLTEKERRFFMKGIAAYMASKNLQNQILPSEFNEAIIRLYEHIPDNLSAQSSVVRNEPSKPLKDRIGENINAIEEIQTDVRTYGVLVRDFSRTGALKFPHKSFFEYLFAEYLFDGINFNKSDEYLAIYNSTQANYDKVINWVEALDFLGELFKSSENDNQTKSQLSRILFRKIVSNSSFVFERWWNYIHLFDVSTRSKLRPKYRLLGIFLSIKMLLLQFSLFFMMKPIYQFIVRSKEGKLNMEFIAEYYKGNLFLSILSLIGFFIFIFIYTSMLSTRFFRYNQRSSNKFSIEDKLALWLLLIKSIGISSADLKTSFGKNISKALPALYEQYNLKERIRLKEEYKSRKN